MADVLSWPDDHPRAKVLARTRAAIVASATRLFLKQGFARTGMEGVAADAGIGLMTLYRHFRTKPALFRTVVHSECAMSTLIPDRDAIWRQPPRQALRTFGLAVITTLTEPGQLALRRLVIAEAEQFPELGRAWYEGGPGISVVDVRAYAAERMATGEILNGDADAFAQMYMALLDRLPLRRLIGLTAAEPPEIEAEVDAVVRIILGPATAPPSPA